MHYSTFYQVPLRDMFVRRVLWNMPKIKPEDYRVDSPEQLLPESPQMPLTPPPIITHVEPESPIVFSKRRKRQRTDPNLDFIAPKIEKTKKDAPKMAQRQTEHAVVKTLDAWNKEEMQWVPVPTSSSKEQIKELFATLKRDPDLCRLCGDTFCRDQTWGDPYLVSCAKCGGKYHSFCVGDKPTKNAWRCYKCQHTTRPGLSTRPDDSTMLCQFCNKHIPVVAGQLVEYVDLGNTHNFVHENCAFYSKGVVKREDNWYGLYTAVRESHYAKCSFCHKKGASISCDFPKCRKLFHYVCAKQNECYMVESDAQHLFCDQHMENILKNPTTTTNSVKAHGLPLFQMPLPSSPEISVPQSGKKKSMRNAKRRSAVPDGEDDNPSFQV